MKAVPPPPITQVDTERESADQQLFARRITITATVVYRGRQLTITAEDITADRFCDLLDARFGKPAIAAPAHQKNGNGQREATDCPPLCPAHNRPMKLMKYADKQGNSYMCTAKVGDGWCEECA